MAVSSVVLIGCGGSSNGGENTINPLVLQVQAQAKIAQYAKTDGISAAPTLDDYRVAGITGLDINTLSKMNEYVILLEEIDVDTQGEIQETVNNLTYLTADNDGDGIVNGIDDFPEDSTKKVNTPPVATAVTIALEEEVPTSIVLSGTDIDTSITAYSIVTNPAHGTLTGILPNLTYTPRKNYFGSDSFTFMVNDGKDNSAPATISLNIANINDKPVAFAQDVVVLEDTVKKIALVASDVDNDPITYIITTQPAHGTLTGTLQNLTYTPSNAYTGTDSFIFKVNDGTTDSDTVTVTINVTSDVDAIFITEEYQVENLGKASTIHKNIHLSSPKSLYVLLTNSDSTEPFFPTITHNPKMFSVQGENKRIATLLEEEPRGHHAPASVMAYNMDTSRFVKNTTQRQAKVLTLSNEANKKDVEGDSKVFYLNTDQNTKTTATAKKIVADINTTSGLKTLNIWVSDDSFSTTDDSGCPKQRCVTQSMVDALADTFLKAGTNNDVYDWVTNVYGEEWGSDAANKYTNLIGANDEITILLTDIDQDDAVNGGTIGFFHSKDNEKPIAASGSNGRVMFYADAVLFAKGDSATQWSINDFWPKEMISTLAHEFQHMIHFYQKTVLLVVGSDDADAWLNEMLSEATEDLIATKIRHTGPRGVAYTDGSAGSNNNGKGRYIDFNQDNTRSLTTWKSSLADYAQVNAFGTFLTRNYGGVKVLHDIVHNSKVHEDAVEEATGKNFGELLKEWGVAVFLSDHANLAPGTPTYNTGDFTLDIYNGVTYDLGSINFFNYSPQPSIKTTAGEVKPQGNYYYKIGDNLSGTVTLELNLNGTTEATLIAK
jgi:hypothetical protein